VKKLKVICFLFDLNVGGPTVRARAVYSKMIDEGYNVRIAFPRGEGSAAAYMDEKKIPTDSLSITKPVLPRKVRAFLGFIFTSPASLYRVTKYIKREKPDVIHVNGAFDMIPACAGLLARVPVVWHLNDTVFNAKFSRLLGALVARIATVVVVAATKVGEHYGVMKVQPHVIFAPVDISRFSGRKLAKIQSNPPVLTMIGNWNWIKGQDRFVSVIEKLRQQHFVVSGLIVGGFIEGQAGFWKPIIDSIDANDLRNQIVTPGFSENIKEHLLETDLFLLTSHSEACPISLLESMAMGVPAIVFDVGGVREMLGEGDDSAGIVVEPGDCVAMAEAVIKLLSDSQLYSAMSTNGRKRAKEKFSLEACVSRHKAAYDIAVNSPKFEATQ